MDLFSIYINSLPYLPLKGALTLIADNTTIIYLPENYGKIQNIIKDNLDKINIWLQQHKLINDILRNSIGLYKNIINYIDITKSKFRVNTKSLQTKSSARFKFS